MAGLDHVSNGEADLSAGYTVGILSQEPVLDETKTVLGNVEDGVAETKALVDRYNEISEQMADPDADFDALHGRDGRPAGEDRPPRTPGTSTASSSRRWTRCAARRRTPT